MSRRIESPEPAAPGAARGDEAGPAWLRGVPGPTLACFAVLAVGVEVLVGMVLTSEPRLWYDEVWYLRVVDLLHRMGLTRAFLLALPGPAGPLHAIVHAAFEPLTGLEAPGVRLVTIGLALGTVAALAAAMKGRGISYAFPKALGLFGAPMAWGPIGTAMTEMPAIFFYCLSLALLVAAVNRAGPGRLGATALGALGGLACGAAIIGRQYFLFAPVIAPIVCRRGSWRVAIAYALGAAVIAAPVFLAWGDIVPPSKAGSSGFSFRNGALSLAYSGLAYTIYDATWLRSGWGRKLAVIAAVTALNLAFGFLALVPFLGSVYRLPPRVLEYYARAGCGLMMGFGLLFAADLAVAAWRRRDDRFFLLLAATAAVLIAAPAKNTEMFAGRYVITALPLLIFLAAERAPDTYGKAARLALGCAAGARSMHAYLHFARQL